MEVLKISKFLDDKGINVTAAIVIVVIVIAAVGIGAYVATRPAAKPVFKIAVVSDIGGRGDLAFNDMGFKGGEMAEKDFDVKMVELISKSEADYLPNLRAAAADPDVKLIVGVGFLLTDAISTVEKEYPDKDFMNIDSVPAAAPNSLGVLFEEHKGSALVGALATMLAAYYDYPHIGICLGMEIPVLWKFEIGYKWGCDWAVSWIENNKPELENKGICATPKKERVLWTYTGTFSDITKGYDTAKAMYAEDAIAVYNVAGPLGLGINQAVKEIAEAENLENGPPFWIGVDTDQDWINPGFIIASMMKRVDYGVYFATELVMKDKFRNVVQEYNGAIKLGIGTEVLGIPMEGIFVSTLDDLDAFLKMGIDAGIIGPENRDAIYAKVKAMRDAQPSWIWEAVGELENRIRTGTENVPEADTSEEVEYWRGILG
jgi:basic membrane protein A